MSHREPSPGGDYRRFCIDVASNHIEKARAVLNEITGRFELIEFDQRHIYPENVIKTRMGFLMTFYMTGNP